MPSTDVDQEVRAKLFQLMTGLLQLRDFQIWFAPVAWRLGRPENLAPILSHGESRCAWLSTQTVTGPRISYSRKWAGS